MIRWLGTLSYLVGMILTSLNVYPTNLIFGAVGGVAWAVVGLSWKDRALIVVEVASAAIYLFGLVRWAYS